MHLGSQSFIVFLLYLHTAGVGVDVGFAKFQSEDAFDFIPALSCLGGLMDECVDEATWFGLSQVCAALC